VLKDWYNKAISIDQVNDNLAEIEEFEIGVRNGTINIDETKMKEFTELDS
jgi:hypothetical protein